MAELTMPVEEKAKGYGRYWCMKCGRGSTGEHNGECPQCIERGEKHPGILMTPDEVKTYTKERGKARKLASERQISKGHKTQDEMKDELRKELSAEYDAKLENAIARITAAVEGKKQTTATPGQKLVKKSGASKTPVTKEKTDG